MGNSPLIDIKPGAGLETGFFPTAEPTSGPIWRTGNNAWFRPLSVSHILGREKAVNLIGRAPLAMAQAFADGQTRLYYEDLGQIFYWTGSGSPTLIDELDPAGEFDLEPFGTWLLATDNVVEPQLWQNDLNGFAAIGNGEFATGKIIKKLGQRVLIYATDVLPQGVHYSKLSDPEEFRPVVTNVATGAGNLPFRDLDSALICVSELAGGHAVYTENKMLFLQYLGETLKFGTPNPPISGIGAASAQSIISRGARNLGLFEGGIFITDGVSFKLVDDPALSDWLRTEVDWTRKSEIAGYYDKKLLMNVWSVPTSSGNVAVGLGEKGEFTFLDGDFSSALEQDVFDYPLLALSSGIYKASIKNTVIGTMEANTQLLDGGTKERYKAWDFALFEGNLSGEVRFGFTDEPTYDSILWYDWVDLEHRVPFTPRESVFLAIQIRSDEVLNLCGIRVYGALGGLVT